MNHIVAVEGFIDTIQTFSLLEEARYILAAQESPPQFTVSDIPARLPEKIALLDIVIPGSRQTQLDRIIIRNNLNTKRPQMVLHLQVLGDGEELVFPAIPARFPEISITHIVVDETKVILSRYAGASLLESRSYPGHLGIILLNEYRDGCSGNESICLTANRLSTLTFQEFTSLLDGKILYS